MLRRVSLTVSSRLALTVFGLLSSIISARALGEAGRGDYFFMVTLSATIVQFTNFGLPSAATYYVAQDRRLAASVVANAAWVSVVAATGTGVAVALVAHAVGMLQDTRVSFLFLAAFLSAPTLFFVIVANVLTGQERFAHFNVVEAMSRAVALAAVVTAAVIGAGAGGFVGATIVAWAIASFAVGWTALRGGSFRLRFDAELFSRGFRYATKAYVITLLAFLVLRANIFLLRREFGPAELGLYSVAAQISDVLAIVPQSIALVLFPRLVRESGDRWIATRRAALTTGALMMVVCGFAAIVGGPVIRLLYGASYGPSANVLRIMLPGVVCLGVANVISQYLGAEGNPRILLAVWGGAAALVVTLSLLLVPHHAGAGAAAALSVTYALVLVAIFAVAHRYRQGAGEAMRVDLEEMPPGAE
jgi:O-antigen/teichoic acid export membrane protein